MIDNRWKLDRRRVVRALLAMGTAGLLAGCAGCSPRTETDGAPDGRLNVVTSLFPYYVFARQIGGEEIDLSLVVPAGMDSHAFEPTPADMRMIQEADIIFCNGGEMENWLEQVLASLDTSDIQVVTMMDFVDAVEEEIVEGMEDSGHGHEHGAADDWDADDADGWDADGADDWDADDADGGHDHDHEHELDEHIWTSPRNAQVFARVIGDALAGADPGHAALYGERTEAYIGQLSALDREFEELTAGSRRHMMVVADKFPFRYLADDYGLEYRAAFSGCSSDSEPSARTIAYLIDMVREQEIPAVYYLELKTPRVAEIIGEETGAEPLLLHSCHNVTRREFESGVTYLQLMEQNVENLRKGLN